MREPPPHVSDDDILAAVRDHWLPSVTEVEHLPVGFGAHHWVARAGGTRELFVTLDGLGRRHTAVTLEATYAAAAELRDAGLDCVVPCLRSGDGTFTVPVSGGALSATPWTEGRRPPDASPALELVRRLHATSPPPSVIEWRPLVPSSLAEDLALRVATPWSSGPFAERVRRSLAEHDHDIAEWTTAYHQLAVIARELEWGRRWVPTHGEPHERNLLETATGVVLVDWESLRLAPPERDLRVLNASEGDPRMMEMFDLEWRLDEIAQYASWFEAPHSGTEDDRIALGGLLHELERP